MHHECTYKEHTHIALCFALWTRLQRAHSQTFMVCTVNAVRKSTLTELHALHCERSYKEHTVSELQVFIVNAFRFHYLFSPKAQLFCNGLFPVKTLYARLTKFYAIKAPRSVKQSCGRSCCRNRGDHAYDRWQLQQHGYVTLSLALKYGSELHIQSVWNDKSSSFFREQWCRTFFYFILYEIR
jgi:hypothetical protein